MGWRDAPEVGGTWEAAPLVDAPEAQPRSALSAPAAFASGVNRFALTGLPGLPADTLANVADLGIAAYGTGKRLIGGPNTEMPDPLDRSKVPFTSTWIADRINRTQVGRDVIGAGAQQHPTLHAAGVGTGAAMMGGPGAVPRGVAGAASGAGSQFAHELTGSNEAAILASMAPQAAGRLMTPDPTKQAQQRSVNALRDQTLAAGREAGFVVPPATTNPTPLVRAVEGLAGKASTAQGASTRNQQVTNALVKRDLGLPANAPITKESLEAVRRDAARAYEPVRRFGTIAADREFIDEVIGLNRQAQQIARAFPDLDVNGAAAVQRLTNGLLVDQVESSAAVDVIRTLRHQSSRNLSPLAAANPESHALGLAQRAAADALEDLLERQISRAGQTQLVDNMRAARQTIAKSYSAEGALNPDTGNVNASKLVAQMRKGKPLSGGMETAGSFARAFPQAMREPNQSMPGMSPLDWMAGGAAAIGMGDPLFAATALTRPVVRAGLLTKPGNRLAVPNYDPGALSASSRGATANALQPYAAALEARRYGSE